MEIQNTSEHSVRRRRSKLPNACVDNLDSLSANPASVHSVLNTLQQLSIEVAKLKKERAASARASRLPPHEGDKSHSAPTELEDQQPNSAGKRPQSCEQDQTGGNSTSKCRDLVPTRSARQIERANCLIEKLRRQFGFPYEGIVRFVCDNDCANSNHDDEFDLIHALFRGHFLHNDVDFAAHHAAVDDASSGAIGSENGIAKCLQEEADLRAKGGIYDNREQVWRIPLSAMRIAPYTREKCSLYIFVAPAHQRRVFVPPSAGSLYVSQQSDAMELIKPSTSKFYPFQFPPFFVESDCNRFRGADSERLIREIIVQLDCVRISSLSGEPFLTQIIDVATKLIGREYCQGPFTANVPKPLSSSYEQVGVLRGAVSALATLPVMLREVTKHADVLETDEPGTRFEEPLLRGLRESIAIEDLEGKLNGPVSMALKALLRHDLSHKAEVSELRLTASDLTSQLEVFRQLRARQHELRSVELKDLLWKHVESRIQRHKSHVRRFFLDGATLSWQPTSHATLTTKLAHHVTDMAAKSSHAKSLELTATTRVCFCAAAASANDKSSLSFPAGAVTTANLNLHALRRTTTSIFMSPTTATCTTPLTSSNTIMSTRGGHESDTDDVLTPNQSHKIPTARRNLGAYKRESFSKVSLSRTSMFSTVSRSARDRNNTLEETMFSINDGRGRLLVMHANSREESERWVHAMQGVVALIQEIEQLESQL